MDALFRVYKLNEQGKQKAEEIATEFNALLVSMQTKCEFDATREFALVKTHLELACFYAKKAMAQQSANHE